MPSWWTTPPPWLRRVRDQLLYGLRHPAAPEIVAPPEVPLVPDGLEIVAPAVVPPAIDLVYDVASAKLTKQLADIDQLDTKAGVLVGALVAAAGVFLATAHLPQWARALFAAFLLASTALALAAFLVRRYEDAPNPQAFAIYAILKPGEVKTVTLSEMLAAWRANERKRVLKGRLINASILLAGVGATVALIARAV